MAKKTVPKTKSKERVVSFNFIISGHLAWLPGQLPSFPDHLRISKKIFKKYRIFKKCAFFYEFCNNVISPCCIYLLIRRNVQWRELFPKPRTPANPNTGTTVVMPWIAAHIPMFHRGENSNTDKRRLTILHFRNNSWKHQTNVLRET